MTDPIIKQPIEFDANPAMAADDVFLTQKAAGGPGSIKKTGAELLKDWIRGFGPAAHAGTHAPGEGDTVATAALLAWIQSQPGFADARWKSLVTSAAELPTEGNTIGDVRMVELGSHLAHPELWGWWEDPGELTSRWFRLAPHEDSGGGGVPAHAATHEPGGTDELSPLPPAAHAETHLKAFPYVRLFDAPGAQDTEYIIGPVPDVPQYAWDIWNPRATVARYFRAYLRSSDEFIGTAFTVQIKTAKDGDVLAESAPVEVFSLVTYQLITFTFPADVEIPAGPVTLVISHTSGVQGAISIQSGGQTPAPTAAWYFDGSNWIGGPAAESFRGWVGDNEYLRVWYNDGGYIGDEGFTPTLPQRRAWNVTLPDSPGVSSAVFYLKKDSSDVTMKAVICAGDHTGPQVAESDPVDITSADFSAVEFFFPTPIDLASGDYSIQLHHMSPPGPGPGGGIVWYKESSAAGTPAASASWQYDADISTWIAALPYYPIGELRRVVQVVQSSDQIPGELLAVDFTPANYTPTDDTLGGHLDGIDAALGLPVPVADHAPTHVLAERNPPWIENSITGELYLYPVGAGSGDEQIFLAAIGAARTAADPPLVCRGARVALRTSAAPGNAQIRMLFAPFSVDTGEPVTVLDQEVFSFPEGAAVETREFLFSSPVAYPAEYQTAAYRPTLYFQFEAAAGGLIALQLSGPRTGTGEGYTVCQEISGWYKPWWTEYLITGEFIEERPEGSDLIPGDDLAIDLVPVNYAPADPSLGEHLAAIDDALGEIIAEVDHTWIGSAVTASGDAVIYPTSTGTASGDPVFSAIDIVIPVAVANVSAPIDVPAAAVKSITTTEIHALAVRGVNNPGTGDTMAWAPDGTEIKFLIRGIKA
jgi:hypothetical protein